MHFVKTENLKTGMRIARPIYNKKGVLLYDRDSKLTTASISSISNFGLIGIYVLDPAEPLPPMTEEDIEFERFQTVNVFALKDEIDEITKTHHLHRLEFIANDIIRTYGQLHHRINFTQNIRSKEDYVYKHSLNVAILSAMMSYKMGLMPADFTDCINACLIHDIGKTTIPAALLDGAEDEDFERMMETSQDTGFELIDTLFPSNPNVKRFCTQTYKILQDLKNGREQEKMRILVGTRVMLVAETFDSMTAMSATGKGEPHSYLEALRFLMSHPEVFNKKAVEALVDSIQILSAGVSVELSNGEKALVISTNTGNILYPMVLVFSTNQMMDLSNRNLYGDLEIVDVVKTMDDRYSLK